jgi:hypothetical protein
MYEVESVKCLTMSSRQISYEITHGFFSFDFSRA